MMMSAHGRRAPERMQADNGPPWSKEDPTTVRMLNYDVKEAVPVAVKVQIDIRVDRPKFLQILRSLARENVRYAKTLVAGAEDSGGAHAKLEHLLERFGPRVVMEVHDLLVQPTRADQVCMVLHELEREFPQGVDTEAIKLLCCTGEQAEVHLTVEGQALWELLTRAEPSVRSEGHAAYVNERATDMTDRSQSAGASSALLGMRVMRERRVASSSSSDAPASDADALASDISSPSSNTHKRHHQPDGSPQASEGEIADGSMTADM